MEKINTSPLSGMQELLPAEQASFDKLSNAIQKVYRHHGFNHIETPHIERADILLAKAGNETEKQIYFVSKTSEKQETGHLSSEALRFDHTVPLSRYIVEHERNLAFPIQVTQNGRNFRGERAQKGRFREFHQLDVDIVGRGELAIAYDAKTIATIYEALHAINLKNIQVRISNRKILSGLLEFLKLQEFSPQISRIIDRSEKVKFEISLKALSELGIPEESITKIANFIKIKGSKQTIKSSLCSVFEKSEDELQNLLSNTKEDEAIWITGLREIFFVYDLLMHYGLDENVIIDFMIIRGLDYYTGTIFETFLLDHRQIGSIASGGRYDNLANNFSKQHFPGVGGSIGLTRLFSIFQELDLIKNETTKAIDYCLIPLSPAEYSFAIQVANSFPNNSVDIIYGTKKISQKLSHAAKNANFAIIIGPDEVSSRQVKVKNLNSGEITTLNI